MKGSMETLRILFLVGFLSAGNHPKNPQSKNKKPSPHLASIEFKSGYGLLFYVPTQRANACVFEHDEIFKRPYANSQADSQVSNQLKSCIRSDQHSFLRSTFLDFTLLRTLDNRICKSGNGSTFKFLVCKYKLLRIERENKSKALHRMRGRVL